MVGLGAEQGRRFSWPVCGSRTEHVNHALSAGF